MKKIISIVILLLVTVSAFGQAKIEYLEYDLKNGMHVILHEDHSAPVVTTAVMYHVGAKRRKP